MTKRSKVTGRFISPKAKGVRRGATTKRSGSRKTKPGTVQGAKAPKLGKSKRRTSKTTLVVPDQGRRAYSPALAITKVKRGSGVKRVKGPNPQRLTNLQRETAAIVDGRNNRRRAATARKAYSRELYGSRAQTPYLRGRVAVNHEVENAMSDRFVPVVYEVDLETNERKAVLWKDKRRGSRFVGPKSVARILRYERAKAETRYLQRVYELTPTAAKRLDPEIKKELLDFNDY